MRNLKKILALVLVLVMAMSFASAAYADADSINYTEAVDVMSYAGIFNGIDGEFQPQGDLTREQAMKIVAYMLLGQKTADALPKDIKPFADVPAGKWSAGAIAYCANKGIVSGDGTGNFNPTANVTGYEFGKMVMGAAGITGEFTGNGWEFNVALALDSYGLLAGLETITLSDDMTREQACQLAFNAAWYTAASVKTGEYKVVALADTIDDKGTEDTSDDVVTYEVKAEAKAMNGTKFDSQTSAIVTMSALDCALNVDYALLALYTHEGSLLYDVHGISNDDWDLEGFGIEANVWYNRFTYDPIVINEETAYLSFSNKTMTTGDLYAALGYTYKHNAKGVTVDAQHYVDGVAGTTTVAYKGTTELGGNGVETHVFWNKYTKELKIVEISTYIGEVKDVTPYVPATAESDAIPVYAYITVNGVACEALETEAYKEGDKVLVNKVGTEIVRHTAATPVVGYATKYVAGESVTVNGTVYKKAQNAVALTLSNPFSTATVYYTDGVNVYDCVAYSPADIQPDGYVFVTQWQTTLSGKGSTLFTEAEAASAAAKAEVMNLDGSFEVVDLSVSYNAKTKKFEVADPTGTTTNVTNMTAAAPVCAWVAYELVDGEYNFLYQAGQSLTIGATAGTKILDGSYTLTSKTTYTYWNLADETSTTVTGWKNIKNVDTANALIVADPETKVVSAIYAVNTEADVVSSTAKLAYCVSQGAQVANGYEYTFFIGGEKQTLIVVNECVNVGYIFDLVLNEDGEVEAATQVSKVYMVENAGTKVTLVDEDYIALEGGAHVQFDKDCVVYSTKTGAEATIEAGSYVIVIDVTYYVDGVPTTDGDADLIYVVEK